MSLICISAINDADRNAAFKLRYEVYVSEQQKRYAADHRGRVLSDDLDRCASIILVKRGGAAVGTVRANWSDDPRTSAAYRKPFAWERFSSFPPNSLAVASRLAVRLDQRTTAVAAELFRHIYQVGQSRETLFCFSQCGKRLLPLFLHYGFREYLPPMVDPVVGILHVVVLVMNDLAHLNACRSPFAVLARSDAAHSVEWFYSVFQSTVIQSLAPHAVA